ncbi:hypothetical protein BYT27DRAFT_7222929 [Phlegmacium glaucopus]|nr:hypothetical protein BYT27DRAFT_7222929 [Phlegmacium glaucopus]
MDVAPGELAVFCPACPQLGTNLPDNWLMDKNCWVYRRFFVADGNFKADHAEYKDFLRTATEQLTAMLLFKACDITGIVVIACARHGCFALNSIVDLTRGEQQKNVDWAFLEAIWTTLVNRDQGVMLIYDIACQYFIHLQDRIGNWLPLGLDIDQAIGLFHVHAIAHQY